VSDILEIIQIFLSLIVFHFALPLTTFFKEIVKLMCGSSELIKVLKIV
jgi:hypothetical protein